MAARTFEHRTKTKTPLAAQTEVARVRHLVLKFLHRFIVRVVVYGSHAQALGRMCAQRSPHVCGVVCECFGSECVTYSPMCGLCMFG